MKKIIHIDMDAFFASIEQRDNVDYREKPLAVGHGGGRGVVAAASYEARQYGVYSAMSSKVALRKCPKLLFAPMRYEVYESVSDQIMEIFLEYTDLVEPLSLDEAFLDVTQNNKNIELAMDIAKAIKLDIWERTGLTASAGVSYNKFLAKIASDIKKPNGLTVIHPKRAEKFVEKLEIEKFFGVGKVTAKRMHQLGIYTGYDLKQKTELELVSAFGKQGSVYYQNARAIDNREVNPERERKSVGAETTFWEDIDSYEDLFIELDDVVKDVSERIREADFQGRTISLKLKYANFQTITRSKTFLNPVVSLEEINKYSRDLLRNIDISPKIRLIGVSLSNSINTNEWVEAIQLSLEFKEYEDN